MKTAKEEIRDLLNNLPEDATLEDIQYHIYVRMKVGRGLESAERGELVTQDEMEARLPRWTAK